MAYTYNDFINAANSSGVLDRFSQEDLTVAQKSPEYGLSMVSLMKDISGATTAEQRLLATEAANQLRKNYGVYGTGNTYAGSFGSQISDLQNQLQNYGSFNYDSQKQLDQLQHQLQNYGSFNYGNETIYQQLLNSIANQQPFSYDPQEDPTHAAYKKAYLREGERASANALAQASAASGGQVSSYAAQAAQQANNYYVGQLADIIPALEQNAYQRYLSDFESRLSGLSALQSDRNFSYQAYLDQYEQAQNALNNLQNDRAQAQEDWLNGYNMLQNNLSNLQQQDATDYQRYLDQYEQGLAEQQYADQKAQLEYENALALYQLLGYATPEVAEILGLNTGKTSTSGNTSSKGKGSSPGATDLDPVLDPTEGTETLSTAVQNFMASLPYAHAGSSPEAWSKVVLKRLNDAYDNGTLSENEAKIIADDLGIYNVKLSTTGKTNGANKTASSSKLVNAVVRKDLRPVDFNF